MSSGRKETIKEIQMNKFGAKVNNDGEDSHGFQMTRFHDKQTLVLYFSSSLVEQENLELGDKRKQQELLQQVCADNCLRYRERRQMLGCQVTQLRFLGLWFSVEREVCCFV